MNPTDHEKGNMIHIRQGKRPRKRFLPLRLLTVDQLIKKAQQGSEGARKELEKRLGHKLKQ